MNDKDLVIVRIFDAPHELVWKAWTEPEMFKKWWGPKNFTAPVSKIDFKVGGKYLCCMRGKAAPDAEVRDFWSTGIYREIIPMEKIVYTDSFSDENGNPVPSTYYGMEGFDMELDVTVLFEDMNGKTKMTLRHKGLPEGIVSDMTSQGWNQSFDKFAKCL